MLPSISKHVGVAQNYVNTIISSHYSAPAAKLELNVPLYVEQFTLSSQPRRLIHVLDFQIIFSQELSVLTLL